MRLTQEIRGEPTGKDSGKGNLGRGDSGKGDFGKSDLQKSVVILRLSGQLVGGPDADAVRDTVLSILNQGYTRILVDLKDVSWVNSTGLGILISSHITSANNGGQLKLMRVSKRIESILSVTRLDTVFQIFADEASALKSFQG
jgi:anti-sigma B factor antagonist